jgi:glycosyltransferase involved in cell wall biosynthesis
MEVHLIGNYPPDGQQSMQRFVELFETQLSTRGIATSVVCPQPWLAQRVRSTHAGVGKWLAYIDKHVVFPWQLRRISNRSENAACVYHICDHSNAMYAAHLPRNRTLVTCHDLLAVRGGLGEREAWCLPSRTGALLQKWILRSLCAIPCVCCVSEATRGDFRRLTGRCDPGINYIPSGLNAPFQPIKDAAAREIIAAQYSPSFPEKYVLHVGSALPRKNRAGLIHTLNALGDRWRGHVIFAGAKLSVSEKNVARELNLESRVIEVVRPSHDLLNALYSAAHCLVFPSFAEGFGWPLIEAQSCDCPVICSDLTSVPEVGGNGAIICGATDYTAMADGILSLEHLPTRADLIERGRLNLRRFSVEQMIDQYISVYAKLLSTS